MSTCALDIYLGSAKSQASVSQSECVFENYTLKMVVHAGTTISSPVLIGAQLDMNDDEEIHHFTIPNAILNDQTFLSSRIVW